MTDEVLIKLGVDGTSVGRGLKRAGESVNEWAGELKSKLTGLLAFGAIEELTRSTMEWGHQLELLSKRTGINTDHLQKFDYAASRAGTTLDAVTNAVEKLAIAQAKAQNDKGVFDALERLGLSKDNINNLGNAAENFKTIGETLRKSGTDGQALKDLVEVMGKGAREMLPLFKNGLQEAGDQLERMGALAKEADLEAMAEASLKIKDAWFEIRATMAGIVPITLGLIGDMAKFIKLVWIPISTGFDPKKITPAQAAFIQHVQFDVLDPYNLHGKDRERAKAAAGAQYGVEDSKSDEAGMKFFWREYHDAVMKLYQEDQKHRREDEAWMKKKLELTKEIGRVAEQVRYDQQRMAEAKLAPYQMTVEELASSGRWGKAYWTGQPQFQQNWAERSASEIQMLTADARNSYFNPGRRNADIERIDFLRKALEDAGIISPERSMEKMAESLDQSKAHIAELVQQFEQGTAIVSVKEGE